MSMEMVNAVAALGFDRLQATPHQRSGMFMPDRESIAAGFEWLAGEVARVHPGVQLGLGAENYWDEIFLARLHGQGLPLYDQGPAFLFELNPGMVPPRFVETLFELRLKGRLPVMAHPERYQCIQKDPARAEAFGRSAALVVDLGAIDGAHGRTEMKTARRLLEERVAHAAATDIHSPDDQRAIAAGMAWIKKRLGPQALPRLLDLNPRRILAGELPES